MVDATAAADGRPARPGATVVVSNVRKAFEGGRISALRDVSLELAPGELVALTGASGSGKSTLLNLIGALDTPDAGSIEVDGVRVDQLRHPSTYRATVVGFVFQAHNLLPTLSASGNVQMAMFGRRGRHDRETRAEELLAEVGLAARSGMRPTVLSGGERQRVAIARALANEPRLLLADEPTGSLDSATGLQIIDLLQSLRAQHGTTILLVTNDDAVAAHADRILRLRDGVILAAAPRSETATAPATSGTAPR